MTWDFALELLGFIVGMIYLWYEYHANSKLWIASVIMPIISMWIFFSKGLYADFAINIYYLLIAIYGYMAWTFNFKKKEKRELPISHMPLWAWGVSSAAFVALWSLMAWVLIRFTDSTVPYLDSFTTSLSIVAMWMLAHKYVEQWYVWILVDAVYVVLYVNKGIYLYGLRYLIYTIIAFLGFCKWRRMMAEQTRESELRCKKVI